MRRYFFIALRLAVLLLLLLTGFMWARSHFKAESFGVARTASNDAYTKWWMQLDSHDGRCFLQVGRGWPLTVPANLPATSDFPLPSNQLQIPRLNQGARPSDETLIEPSFTISIIFPEHPTGHWYSLADRSIGGAKDAGTFGFNRMSEQREAHIEVHFPYWSVLLMLIAIFILIELTRRKTPSFSVQRCSRCGYDLRATPQRCPECGTVPSV